MREFRTIGIHNNCGKKHLFILEKTLQVTTIVQFFNEAMGPFSKWEGYLNRQKLSIHSSIQSIISDIR